MLNIAKLLDKSECIALLCYKATTHWSLIKFCFQIPLVLTSSAMCIINSINQDANDIKIYNIAVNAISVLIISVNNSVKASEKYELFKKLSQSFIILSQEIESLDNNCTPEQYRIICLKYDNLILDVNFEDCPSYIKRSVSLSFSSNNRFIPIQLNGVIGQHNRVRSNLELGSTV